ncbi:MAG: choice-of-anchor J domain-containing protein, partial [Bacteroidales bacterium]|nr:choice-of-anchor J domain-containing protein [Bacteroidales bacterium]
GNQIVPECHNSSSGMMLSESYISASTSGGSGTAVTPDNYLVSPQIELGGSFAFYAASRMSNYPAEKFSVVLSTSGNTSASSFTETLLTVTLSDNSWNEYTVDLSAYSGQGYVAIRHYDCTDQHLLYVDDITIVEGEGGTNPSNPTNPTTDLLTANVYVRLKGGLGQGFYNETLSVTTGDVTSNVGLNGEVYPTLAAGWNWWTPTKAMTLGQLEEALGGNAVLINTQGDGFARYENGQWSGTLTEIAAGQMYKIEATSSVSLTMSGTPATGVSLTILTGYNWFGYTGAQSADIVTALGSLGITPASGDTITDKNGNTATYNGSSWSGNLATLLPGHGYVYDRQQ